jgi:PAS domain S-box-containing protein
MRDGTRALRILLVEDSKNDAHMLERHLAKGGIPFELTRVDARQALQTSLNQGGWDLLISDYVLPAFDGLAVVKMARSADPDLPCIIISGHVGEEYAVEALRAGARDFISKANLARLIPAIQREMNAEEGRRTAHRTEVHLLESEARFRAISEAAQDAIVMINPKGEVSFWNHAAERIFGYSPREVLGKDLHELIALPAQQEAYRRVFSSFVETGEGNAIGQTLQLPALTKDRREIHVELSLSRAQFQDGWHGIGIIRDLTQRITMEAERAAMEVQLLQAHKLEAIGQLAAGIAHEINTPTQYIGDNTTFLRDTFREILDYLETVRLELAKGDLNNAGRQALQNGMDALGLDYLQEEIPKAIQQSLEGVARVSKIVSAMKDFSHPSLGVKGLVDLNHAIESTVTVCRNEWKYVADLELNPDPALPLVPCFADEFNQVVLNLIINAAHAIEEANGGQQAGAKGLIRVSTRLGDQHVEIRVSDTGTGIPDRIRDRIFDPFFTTKPLGKGTGQGLAIARSVIVDKHGGTIRVESELGKGTTFVLELPVGGSGSSP